MEMKLVIEGLAKSYPGRPVFKDIAAEAGQGEVLVVAGPNGSGKSTLLRIICGFIRPTSGYAYLQLDGKKLGRLDIRPYIGLVSPDLVLYEELSALENLSFFAEVSGLIIPMDRLRGDLAKVGLENRGHDRVGSYSSGMKQRLKYCLALMRNPSLLLLDEPMSNLDDRGKELVDGIIKTHKGILVIATNERSELEYGSQIIRLDR
jgi:heme exporter protein A